MKKLNIALIGYGFMGRTHSNAFRQSAKFFNLQYEPVLKCVCARDAAKAQAFADNWGYEGIETDWRKLIERKDIDVIDIAAPNNVHADIAIAAAKAGKMILCEKPLSMDGPQGKKMVAAVEKAGVPNSVSLPRQVPSGLDHQSGTAPGRCWAMALGREGRRIGSHGGSPRPLHRHGHLAQRRGGEGQRHDRDLREGAQTQPERQG
jgi:hypothetical protein